MIQYRFSEEHLTKLWYVNVKNKYFLLRCFFHKEWDELDWNIVERTKDAFTLTHEAISPELRDAFVCIFNAKVIDKATL